LETVSTTSRSRASFRITHAALISGKESMTVNTSGQVQAAEANSRRCSGEAAVDRIRPWQAPGSEEENLLEGPGKTKENEVRKKRATAQRQLPGSPNHLRRFGSHGNYADRTTRTLCRTGEGHSQGSAPAFDAGLVPISPNLPSRAEKPGSPNPQTG